MDNSALNKAHLEYRRADVLMRSKKFMEAIKCHESAAAYLHGAMDNTVNPRSMESIKLQRDYHIRQKDIILVQKKRNELRRAEICRIRNLPDAIHETLEKTDLLLVLLREGGEADLESLKSMTPSKEGTDINQHEERCLSLSANCSDTFHKDNNAVMMVLKHAKDKYVVVEELVTLNEQLHAHIYSLVEQLETKEREICELRDRLSAIETQDNGNNDSHFSEDATAKKSQFEQNCHMDGRGRSVL